MRTTKEESNEYILKEFGESTKWKSVTMTEELFLHNCRESFEAGVEFAQRWIGVNDELPKEYQTVLAKRNNYIVTAIFYDKVFYESNTAIKFVEATHWRPIEIK